MSTYNELMHIDVKKLEAERFTLQPDQARAMLTKAGKLRKRAPKGAAKKTRAVAPQPEPKVKRRATVLHLTEAQQRAYQNYVEGKTL